MPPVNQKQLKLLSPYLESDTPNEDGEIGMRCPLHEDHNRSASVNVHKGLWICYMGCGSGAVISLIRRRDEWLEPVGALRRRKASKDGSSAQLFVPTEAHVAGWASALLESKEPLREFRKARMLTRETIKRFNIGWARHVVDQEGRTIAKNAYTIPVYDASGNIANIRFYQLNPTNDRRKIWGVTGMNRPHLFPISVLDDDADSIVVCEGELDAMICVQNGIPAITRTASATTWDVAWNTLLKGKRVYLAHDCDSTGQRANVKLLRCLRGTVQSVVPIRLPYKIREKHGKDLTDFFKDGYKGIDLRELMKEADAEHAPDRPIDLDPSDASILETLDSARVGRPQRIVATVRGKTEPGYSIPRTVELNCSTDRGESICQYCPLYGAGGKARVTVASDDPLCLGLIDATRNQVTDAIREKYGALKCPRLQSKTIEYQAVETLFVRPSVEHVRHTGTADFSTRKITSVGKHDTPPNTTVRITGALQPDPRSQRNEFLAWIVEEQKTSLDSFEITPEIVQGLKLFQPSNGQRPLTKRVEVARELSREVTKIYGRDEMHVAMDLVWHSAIAFDFDKQPIDRGWVELLIIGDTRTGKSEADQRLTEHYQAGEIVSCESASFAGIVGGLQQFSGSGEWTVNWGVIPMNDRRKVTLDEAGGLSREEISQLSSVRSSGRAQLTKIRQDETSARTRLTWLANSRSNGMDKYLYGVDAISDLIGNPEDIARFTLAMCVRRGEVPLEVMNSPRETGKLSYTSELCHSLIMWCWSRSRDQIEFTDVAVKETYKSAIELGQRYVEYPPLVQAANVRVKIASLAVALAGATFSTDDTHEKIIVKRQHVQDAVRFMDHIYAMPSFGYLERSQEAHRDNKRARSSERQARRLLAANPGLTKFLRMQTKFKRQDIEEVLNYSRESSNALINQLHEMRMIQKQGGFVVVSPILHDVLRNE